MVDANGSSGAAGIGRFDCPSCRGSLRGRVLPHVPRENGELAFSCIHCNAILGYAEGPITWLNILLATRTRRVVTFFAGAVILSMIGIAAGKAVSLGIVAAIAIGLAAAHFLSRQPAYKVLENG